MLCLQIKLNIKSIGSKVVNSNSNIILDQPDTKDVCIKCTLIILPGSFNIVICTLYQGNFIIFIIPFCSFLIYNKLNLKFHKINTLPKIPNTKPKIPLSRHRNVYNNSFIIV